jgi:hypothetical protein
MRFEVHLPLAFRLRCILQDFRSLQNANVVTSLGCQVERYEKFANSDRVLDESPPGAALFVDAIDEPPANVQTVFAQ